MECRYVRTHHITMPEKCYLRFSMKSQNMELEEFFHKMRPYSVAKIQSFLYGPFINSRDVDSFSPVLQARTIHLWFPRGIYR